jgi:hypothetical protein
VKRRLAFLRQRGRARVEPAQAPSRIRAFLRDPGGHSDAYGLLIWAVTLISIAVGIRLRDETRAALADAIQAISGLLGGWR